MRVSRWATHLMNALASHSVVRHDAVAGRALRLSRRAALMFSDPPVEYTLDGTRLTLPLSHDLPIIRAHHHDYSANLGAVAEALARHRALDRPVRVIDIGANVGDSVAIISARTPAQFLCIEGDHVFVPYLQANTTSLQVYIEAAYIASADSDLAARAVDRSSGTARLVGTSGSSEAVEVRTLDEILSRHPGFPAPDLIKIDTDGHDVGIIRQMRTHLGARHPVVFFEFDPRLTSEAGGGRASEVFGELSNLGYGRMVLYGNTGDRLGVFDSDDPELLTGADRLGRVGEPLYWDVVAVSEGDLGMIDLLR